MGNGVSIIINIFKKKLLDQFKILADKCKDNLNIWFESFFRHAQGNST